MGRGANHSADSSIGPAARRSPTGRKRWKRWTEEELWNELRAVLAGRRYWPTQREFEEIWRPDLYSAVQQREGIKPWAEGLGLELRPAQAHRPNPYSADDARREARGLIDQHGYLPKANKIRQLGHGRLSGYIDWHHRSSTGFVRDQGWGTNERPSKPRPDAPRGPSSPS